MDWDKVEVNKTQKKDEANIQPSWPKNLGQQRIIIWPKRELCFFAGPTREIPREQDGSILPLWVANRNTGLASSGLRGQSLSLEQQVDLT